MDRLRCDEHHFCQCWNCWGVVMEPVLAAPVEFVGRPYWLPGKRPQILKMCLLLEGLLLRHPLKHKNDILRVELSCRTGQTGTQCHQLCQKASTEYFFQEAVSLLGLWNSSSIQHFRSYTAVNFYVHHTLPAATLFSGQDPV